jgi:hypothetical protein
VTDTTVRDSSTRPARRPHAPAGLAAGALLIALAATGIPARAQVYHQSSHLGDEYLLSAQPGDGHPGRTGAPRQVCLETELGLTWAPAARWLLEDR